MSEITNAEINKLAAEIAGHDAVMGADGNAWTMNAVHATLDNKMDECKIFDIFATDKQGEPTAESAKCILAVVIALGEKHEISILRSSDIREPVKGREVKWSFEKTDDWFSYIVFDTYLEALSAAVQAVK